MANKNKRNRTLICPIGAWEAGWVEVRKKAGEGMRSHVTLKDRIPAVSVFADHSSSPPGPDSRLLGLRE